MHSTQPRVAIRFEECYGAASRQRVEQPAKRALELAKGGRFQAALGQYRQALVEQPFNWVLMLDVSNLLTYALGNPKGGLEVVRVALRHNPGCTADLWNVQGNCLFWLGRLAEARLSYERALAINPDDVRARYNLSFVHVAAREFHQALVRLAEGLALDQVRGFRQAMLQQQAEVLGLLDQQTMRHFQGQMDRVAGAGSAGTGPPVGIGLQWPGQQEENAGQHPVQGTGPR
jgi:tetratricopeptide (TPR) repeat protein